METNRALDSKKKVLVVGVFPDSVVQFRGDLIRAMVHAGHNVTIMTADANDEVRRKIERLGEVLQAQENTVAEPTKQVLEEKCREFVAYEKDCNRSEDFCGKIQFRPYWVQRNGTSIWSDWRTLRDLRAAFRELQPDVILLYTIKPIIWGGIAAKKCRRARVYSLVTGLGYAFQCDSWMRYLLKKLVVLLYRYSLRHSTGVIFQNKDNRNLFVDLKIVRENKCHIVNGSGINLRHFIKSPFLEGPPHFLLIARLLGEKGIREYARAAEVIKQTFPDTIFSLVGPEDPSRDGISIAEVQEWHNRGIVSYVGATNDVRPYIAKCHVYCLPSYYMEGVPRSILEALSMGRPVLTTDNAGCRDTVEIGRNGWLVPCRSVDALVERMIWFIENRHLWKEMGDASREIAEKRFNVRGVNNDMLRIMGLAGVAEFH